MDEIVRPRALADGIWDNSSAEDDSGYGVLENTDDARMKVL